MSARENMTEAQLRETVVRLLIERIGGDEVYEMLEQHLDHRVSLRRIAEWSGLSHPTVAQRIRRALTIMRRHRLLPERWVDAAADRDADDAVAQVDLPDAVASAAMVHCSDAERGEAARGHPPQGGGMGPS